MQGLALTFINVVLFSEFSIHMKLLQNIKSSCYFLMRFLYLFMTSQLEFGVHILYKPFWSFFTLSIFIFLIAWNSYLSERFKINLCLSSNFSSSKKVQCFSVCSWFLFISLLINNFVRNIPISTQQVGFMQFKLRMIMKILSNILIFSVFMFLNVFQALLNLVLDFGAFKISCMGKSYHCCKFRPVFTKHFSNLLKFELVAVGLFSLLGKAKQVSVNDTTAWSNWQKPGRDMNLFSLGGDSTSRYNSHFNRCNSTINQNQMRRIRRRFKESRCPG